MDWAIAVRGTYEDMLAAGRSYGGRQGFPYRWLPSGTEVAESLGPYLGTLYDACAGIAALRIPSFSAIDSMLPQELGRYSMTRRSKCAYLRRHLARWMTRWLYPRGVPDAADWDLCLNGMGRAPRVTTTNTKPPNPTPPLMTPNTQLMTTNAPLETTTTPLVCLMRPRNIIRTTQMSLAKTNT